MSNRSMESSLPDREDPSFSVWMTRLVVIVLAGSLAMKVYLVVSGQWDVGAGDSSHRILLAQHTSLHDRLFTTKFFTDIWPHLPNILQGGMLNFLRATPLGEHVDYIVEKLIQVGFSITRVSSFNTLSTSSDARVAPTVAETGRGF